MVARMLRWSGPATALTLPRRPPSVNRPLHTSSSTRPPDLVYCCAVADRPIPVSDGRVRSHGPAPDPASDPAPRDISALDGLTGATVVVDPRKLHQASRSLSRKGSLLCIVGTNADIGMHVLVEESVLIGRQPPAGFVIHDAGVSRAHARVEWLGQRYVIRDLGSRNGTLVNGAGVHGEAELADGDKIVLGATVLKFTFVDETEAVYLRQVDQLVGTDDLTGLLSKHRFDAMFKEAVRSARAAGLPLAALMMDMDGLKAVNDRHGHQAGAQTVRLVGILIGETLGDDGRACRFGGDEFAAYVPGAGPERALELAERIRHGVEAMRVPWKGAELAVSISIGVASLTPDVTDAAPLQHLADLALYRAKATGKNRVCTWSPADRA